MQKFLFGIHCHQPVDNFHNVVYEAIEKSYAPFFNVAKRFENFKFALHVSGWLLDFWKNNAPEMYADLKLMNEKGQVEFFTGGYYEPILAAIPSRDRKAQIKKLSKFIKNEFGQKPQGLWLTERVWESAIIDDLLKCDIKYAVLDDYHFWASGVDNSGGYYNTEENGKFISLFPIQKALRYALPFAKPQESLNAVLEAKGAAIMFDDGEKFGLWPGTHEWVFEQGWLEQFLTLCNGQVEFVHFKDFIAEQKPLGVIYPPSCSYYEMGEWSLRAQDALTLHKIHSAVKDIAPDEVLAKSVRGGIWKNFLVKYPEAGHIHKRSLEMSKIGKKLNDKAFNDALYRLQTNDCLWHGVFGGLYLPNLRDNAYRYLLECEEIAYNQQTADIYDFNMDGLDEVKIADENMVAVFNANYGGALVELGSKKLKFNFLNTMARYKEAYHEKLVCVGDSCDVTDESGVSTIHKDSISVSAEVLEKIAFDYFPRYSFLDFFSAGEMVEANIAKPVMQNVEWKVLEDLSIECSYKNEKARVLKNFLLKDGILYFKISISELTVKHYSCMLNFHFANYNECDFNGKALKERIFTVGARALSVVDRVMNSNVTLELDSPCNLLIYPIDTASQSEQGIDLTNQAVCVVLGLPVYNDKLELSGSLKIN